MAYFSNRNINALNLHAALFHMLEQSFWLFQPIYLYTQGFTLPEIFLLLAIFDFARIPARFLWLPLLKKKGLKWCLILGTIGYSFAFPVMSQVHGWDGWLLLYTLLVGIFNSMHWVCYHALYTLAGEHKERGRQVAASQTMSIIGRLSAPILSALVITFFGFQAYFMLALPLLVFMLLVLRRCEEFPIAITPWREGWASISKFGLRLQFTESLGTSWLLYPWTFAMYFAVGDIISLGGAVVFGVVVQILWQLFLGSATDRGRGRLINDVAAGLRIMRVFGRALLPLSMPMVLFMEGLSAAADTHYNAVQPTAYFNAAKADYNPFWFVMFAEMGWDMGSVMGSGLIALLLWQGAGLQPLMLLGLVPMLVTWRLLRQYFHAV